MSILKLEAIGHLGRDCSVRHMEDGSVAINFPVAITEKWKGKNGDNNEKTTWVDCTLWKKQETMRISEYLKKGQLVYIEGTPSARGYKAKSSDDIHGALLLRVTDVRLLGGKKAADNTSAPAVAQASNNNMGDTGTVTTASAEEDLPF